MRLILIPDHSPLTTSSRRAFTLIELLIVIALFAILSVASLFLLLGRRNATDLTTAKQQVVAVIRDAQDRSATQEQGFTWGVYFSNSTATAPFYALFFSSYSTSTTVTEYALPASVAYVTSTLAAGSAKSITFAGISGLASASTSVGLYSKSQATIAPVTISIASSGAVSF